MPDQCRVSRHAAACLPRPAGGKCAPLTPLKRQATPLVTGPKSATIKLAWTCWLLCGWAQTATARTPRVGESELQVLAQDTAVFSKFALQKLMNLPNVKDIHTSFSLSSQSQQRAAGRAFWLLGFWAFGLSGFWAFKLAQMTLQASFCRLTRKRPNPCNRRISFAQSRPALPKDEWLTSPRLVAPVSCD